MAELSLPHSSNDGDTMTPAAVYRPIPSIHPLSVTALSLLVGRGGFCWSQSQLSLGEGRVLPGQVANSLMAEAMQGANHTSGASWGCTSTCSSAQPGDRIWTSDLLCPLSYSCPCRPVPHMLIDFCGIWSNIWNVNPLNLDFNEYTHNCAAGYSGPYLSVLDRFLVD